MLQGANLIKHENKIISSWNNTHKNRALVYYPKNISEIQKLLKLIKKEKKYYIIKTGNCSYDSKSINYNSNTIVISLKKINKIIKVDKKKLIIQSGAIISELTNKLRRRKITLFSVPGGEKISIGGAISANVIGKDSSKVMASFGDAVIELSVITEQGKIKKINKAKDLSRYIGSFGLTGIILQTKLKIKKIPSGNLTVRTKILNNIQDIENHLNKVSDYKYIQIDPFFRKKNFAVAFDGNLIKNKDDIYKKINLKSYFFERFIFKLLSFLINRLTWRFFYSLFFYLNKNKEITLDLHNFNYNSKYKHMVPLITSKGLIDYEIMIKNNFKKNMKKIKKFIQINKLYPIYIIVKKTYKSKRNYNYSFNDNGYAVAISLDKKNINFYKQQNFLNLLERNNLKLNLSKTDAQILTTYNEKNFLFMSLYKKMIKKNNKKNDISR